jgi:ubiquinone/menaquinone biosynthesis C-methylase UbiE
MLSTACCAAVVNNLSFFNQYIGTHRYEGAKMSISAAKLKKPEVVDVYSQTAWIYDLWGALTETHARQRALELAPIHNGEAVLEVAVGTGLTFREILQANPDGENIGIDLTPAMLHKAEQKAAKTGRVNYQLHPGDAYHLQFPDQHFDLLINNFMFDLLPEADFSVVLAEFKRVLKPGGRMLLVNMTKAERFYQKIYEDIYRLNPRWLGGCRGVQLVGFVHQAGFTDVRRETVSQLGFPAEILTAFRKA